jgi:hypothetical protein
MLPSTDGRRECEEREKRHSLYSHTRVFVEMFWLHSDKRRGAVTRVVKRVLVPTSE